MKYDVNKVRSNSSKSTYYTEDIISKLYQHIWAPALGAKLLSKDVPWAVPVAGLGISLANVIGRAIGKASDRREDIEQEWYEGSLKEKLKNLIPGFAAYNAEQSKRVHGKASDRVKDDILRMLERTGQLSWEEKITKRLAPNTEFYKEDENGKMHKIASAYLGKVSNTKKYPYYNLANDVALVESVNGKLREGDFVDGVPHSRGLLHIRKVFPGEKAKYEARRNGKPMTYYPVLDDVNDLGYNYTVNDLDDDNKQREIFSIWLQHHGTQYKRKFNKSPNREILLRMWNGGPRGYNNPKTLNYVQEINKRKANPQNWGMQYGVIVPAKKKAPIVNPVVKPKNVTITKPSNMYTVQAGDNLGKIVANRGIKGATNIYNMVNKIKKINNLNSDVLRPNQQLKLPEGL